MCLKIQEFCSWHFLFLDIVEDIHIIGMSATIGNLKDICQFLKADVYTGNFRPVKLDEYVKCGNVLAKVIVPSDKENVLKPVRTENFKVKLYKLLYKIVLYRYFFKLGIISWNL